MNMLYALPIVLLPYSLFLPPDVGVGVSALALLWASLFGRRDPPGLPRTNLLLAPLLGLFLAFLLGWFIALGHDPSRPGAVALEAKYALTYPLLYLAYRHCGLDARGTRQLIMLTLVVAAFAGFHAVSQGLQFDTAQFADGQRATGPFGAIDAANRAGVYFAMFLSMFVALALQPGCQKPLRLMAIVAAGVLVAAILFTFSRQAYVIAAFGIALLLLHRSFTVAAVAMLVVAVIGASLLPDSVIQRIDETRQISASGAVSYDGSTESRLEIWRGAFSMLADHPAGVGLGRFREHIGDYTVYAGMDTHNGFLRVLAECGPLALAMMLWLVWRLWQLVLGVQSASRDSHPVSRALGVGLAVAVIAMLLGNLFGSPYFDGLVMYSFWILCGLMERHAVIQAHAQGERTDVERFPQGAVATGRFPVAARLFPGLIRRPNPGPGE
ncbi:O-antigen ligase family protein [Luteimonas sp. MJ293]|uniref:O-antigen ligase family protein n=1 Tax=Luteimonas sp. MJ146 TaxID=3129240 RepID=UPI0031BA51A0